ncbi:hypothetical protein [Flavobacterium olei]|uniref:hypothetical protein n=1 Tax=Flavobacterium olei TaxID=1886782 RepID=UPI00321BC9E3
MKLLYSILLLILTSNCFAQSFYLNINGTNEAQNRTIDSISYIKKHPNIKLLNNEISTTLSLLTKQGYIDSKIIENRKVNDSTFYVLFDLKTKIKKIHIYIGKNRTTSNLYKTVNDTLLLPYSELENFLNQEISKNEKEGFAFTKIKLENIRKKKSIIHADLYSDSESKRRNLNAIIINYANSNLNNYFPKGAIKQLNKKYTNKIFNQETVKKLHDDINSFEFVTQTKYPEILFTKDSTKVYTYIDKRKANTFDGYIGFSNDDTKKLILNGYLDISLINTLRAGEKFSLYWKSDGNQQKTFNTKLEIPYLFRSPIGIKAQLNIFKQDSTFQNTKTDINLGYFINYNSKLYIGYQATESSDIQNTNSNSLSDFENSYFTTNYEYKRQNNENLFPAKAYINSTIGYGKRSTPDEAGTAGLSKQFFITLNLAYNFELNTNNYIYFNSQNNWLQSKNFITNELFRFGGLNSIRGFSENSLQANFNSLLLTEYRYLPTGNFYLHTIFDYGVYQDQTSNNKKIRNLLSFGVGLGLLTNSGLLKIQIANGSANKGEIKFYNSILNICYNVNF